MHSTPCFSWRFLTLNALIVPALVLGLTLDVTADFAEDFQKAKACFNEGKYEEAHQAFVKLAAVAPRDHAAAASLSFAAISLGRQGKVDQALRLAQTIATGPMAAYTQMEILSDNRKRQAIVDGFKDEDINTWPDAINYKGFFLRGGAYATIGNRPAAIQDFEQCARLAGSDSMVKLDALTRMADQQRAMEDEAKALDTYRTAFGLFDDRPQFKGTWLFPRALLGAAKTLIEQKQYDEARELLAQFRVKPQEAKRGPWDFLVLEAYGDIHAARGEKEDALAKYREAVAIDTHRGYINRVKGKIGALEPAEGGPAE